MSLVQSPFLRRLIAADAVACLVSGAAMVFAGGALEPLTGISPALLQPAGAFLLVWSVLLAVLAMRPALQRAIVWVLIAVNVAWSLESVMMLVLGWAAPTAVGYALVIVQAVAVAGLAELQILSMRRAPQMV